ncbi:predicted protein [Histoplasma capsulatum H143]|uniref:Uncharacterized protein n=1 Tax=Ajellomyces capsulatus (strain H143) TaxID=544712 RepID=C6H7D5_AJECH|nr:predicted protein [Histoplasma capsulatum H143]
MDRQHPANNSRCISGQGTIGRASGRASARKDGEEVGEERGGLLSARKPTLSATATAEIAWELDHFISYDDPISCMNGWCFFSAGRGSDKKTIAEEGGFQM